MNLVEYVWDVPTNKVDPTGLEAPANVFNFGGYDTPTKRLPIQATAPAGLRESRQADEVATTDPDDPKPITCPENPDKCKGGFCVFGKGTKVESCNITKVEWVEGWNPLCNLVTPEKVCEKLKEMIEKQNKKHPGKEWGVNYCVKGCTCDMSKLKWSKAPQEIVFKDDLIRNSGCGFKVSGTITISKGFIAITPCKAKK